MPFDARLRWTPIRYRTVNSLLEHLLNAGVYVYGKSEKRITIVEGRLRKSYGHGRSTSRVPPTEGRW